MQTVFAYAAGILSNTPLWVYALFALLTWLGLLGLEPRTVAIRRVAIVPAVFIVWGLSGLANKPFPAEVLTALWLAGLAGGGVTGLLTGPRLRGVDRVRREVQMPRSWWPLARNLIFFFAHYVLNVGAAILPAKADDLLRATVVVSGASAGYFIGWGVALWQRYRGAEIKASAG